MSALIERCEEFECKGKGFDYFHIANYLMKVPENPQWEKCLSCQIFYKRYNVDYPENAKIQQCKVE